MAVERKRVCIVGGGASGLPSIKACVAEGLEPVCFEQTDDIGGLWNYRPDASTAPTVAKSTVAVTSKELMAYSDFPCPDHFPNFMHHTYVSLYLKAYADHFDLLKYIRLNTRVEKLRHDEDGWEVRLSTGETDRFDAVMVCAGRQARRSAAQLAGLGDAFGGRVLHSQQYGADPSGFERRRVLVVGFGNSALDAAVELSRVAARVFVSTRRGAWVRSRVAKGHLPHDITYLTRFYSCVGNLLPSGLVNDYMEYALNQRMNHEMYGLRPAHRLLDQPPVINDHLPNCLATGAVTLKADVKLFDKTGVTFADDTREQVDAVLLCTGYTYRLPSIEPASLLRVEDECIDLYKLVFAPVADSSLAVVGLAEPIVGAALPIGEMQARWAARVFAGRAPLPSAAKQRVEMERRRAVSKRRFSGADYANRVHYVAYMDELAREVGAKPAVARRLLLDPALGLRLCFGPNLPCAYRLDGPHTWPDARAATLNATHRILTPLQSRESADDVGCLRKSTYLSWLAVRSRAKVFQTGLALALLVGGYLLLGAPNPFGFLIWVALFIVCWSYWLTRQNAYFDFSTLA